MSSNSKTNRKNSRTGSGGVLKIIGIIIVGLALIALVFSSVFYRSSGPSGNSRFVFGKYGNKDIQFLPDNDFGQAVDNEMKRYSSGTDTNNQFFEIVRLFAWQEAFRSVAANRAIEYHVEDSGYQVSSRAVDRYIIDYGPWRTDGAFDENLYNSASAAKKASVRSSFRQQIALSTWSADTLESKYRSSGELDFLEDMRVNVNSYNMVSIPFSAFPEDEVMAYARENSGIFTGLPVSRITTETEDGMSAVTDRLEERSGDIAAFSDAAIELSKDAYAADGGSMGTTLRYRLEELISSEDAQKVFDTAQGEYAGPFETDYGWMLFMVDGAPVPFDAEAGIEEVRSYMLQNEVGIVEETLLARAEELKVRILAEGDFRTAAENSGYEVITTGSFPVNYGGDSLIGQGPENAGIPELSGSVESDAFWKEIIPLSGGKQVSDPVVMSASVALFSLNSSEQLDRVDYWKLLVDSDLSRSSQYDFRNAVLSEENDLFTSNFSETYGRIFPSEG